MEIEIGKKYDYFDDGKISKARCMPVVITNIIPFDKIDFETLYMWMDEVEDHDWLYAKETDYFLKGILSLDTEDIAVIFVRTLDGGWFSLGWWAGRLDVDGNLVKLLQ